MRIAIFGMNPYYESDRVLVEALKMGHEAVYLSKRHIVMSNFFGEYGAYFDVPTIEEQMHDPELFKGNSPVLLKPDESYQVKMTKKGLLGNKEEVIPNLYDLRYFDAFLFREISKSAEWASILVNYLVGQKKVVVDQKIGTEIYYKSKLGTFYKSEINGLPYPKSFATVSLHMMKKMLKFMTYPIIIKKTESSKGLGVYKLNSYQEALDFFKYEKIKPRDVMVQEVIDYRGDIRVIVLGERVIGAMRREPPVGKWKGNVAQGAIATPVEISDEIKKVALDIVKIQKSEFLGVDIMLPKSGPYIIETNRSPQFKGFESSTGINLGKEVVLYLEQKYAKISDSENKD